MSPDIYSSTPINTTAARVTSQAGCASDGTLDDEQLRENLVAKVKRLNEEVVTTPKGPRRTRLGKQIADTCAMINAIRPRKKAKGVDQHFIDAARETLPLHQFNSLMNAAVRRMKENEQGGGE